MTDKLEDKPVTLIPPAEAPITATSATRLRHRPAPVSSKAQQEHAAEEIRAISDAPVAVQVANAPHGSSEDSATAPLPADFRTKPAFAAPTTNARSRSCRLSC